VKTCQIGIPLKYNVGEKVKDLKENQGLMPLPEEREMIDHQVEGRSHLVQHLLVPFLREDVE
jgi:hypothetical protein